jgi:5'-3' exonuclease
MGIKGISDFIKRCSKKKNLDPIQKEKDLSELKNKKIAIDAANLIFRLKAIATSKAIRHDMTFTYNENKSKWEGYNPYFCSFRFYELLINYIHDVMKTGAQIIFVFDGAPPKEKSYILEEREKARNKSKEKVSKYEKDKENLHIYKKSLSEYNKPTSGEWDVAKNIILEMDCECYLANGEAEKLCSFLCKNKKVDAVVSNDTDLYVYGCPIIIKKIKNFSRKHTYECVKLEDILNVIDMDFQTFFNLCLMCGNDYTPRVKGFGPVKLLKLLDKYENYQSICQNHDKFKKKLKEYKTAEKNFNCDIDYTKIQKDHIKYYNTIGDIVEYIKNNMPETSIIKIRYKK